MIGVNTPESVHSDETTNTPDGLIASGYTKAKLEGQTVELEFDAEKLDQYDRTLAYVWLGKTLYNELLLTEGMAQLMTIPPNVNIKNNL